MGGMPWDQPGQPQQGQPYTYQPAPRPQPGYTYEQAPVPPPPPQRPPTPRPAPPANAEQMRNDVVTPRPQHNDLQTMIQNAISEAVAANKDQIQANAQRALVKTVKGERAVIEHRKVTAGDGTIDEIEDAFEGGPVTTRTFFQGMAVDIGFAVMAALGTVMTPGFNAFDKEVWVVTGALIVKTVLTTAMSYAMTLQVK